MIGDARSDDDDDDEDAEYAERVEAFLDAERRRSGLDDYATVEGERRAVKRLRDELARSEDEEALSDAQLRLAVADERRRVAEDVAPQVRAARIERIQPQRRARYRSTGGAGRQKEYSTVTFCARLQYALVDAVRRYACVSGALPFFAGASVHTAIDMRVTEPMTFDDAVDAAAEYDPPAFVVDVPHRRVGDRRRVARFLTFADTVLDADWRAANRCHARRNNIVVRVNLPSHSVVALWLARARTLEIFDSSGSCAMTSYVGTNVADSFEAGWATTLAAVLEERLELPTPHRVVTVCRVLQRLEGAETGGGYCQTWTWFWVYHRLVRGYSADELLERLLPADERVPGTAALAAIERFKARASVDRPIISDVFADER